MIKIQLTEGGRKKILKTANQFDIDSDKLFELYTQVMNSNFEQDLWDIANENEEELKGEII